MTLDDVYVVSNHIKPVDPQTFKQLEELMAAPLPPGYRDYLTRFGKGKFCGWLEVHAPSQVIALFRKDRYLWMPLIEWAFMSPIKNEDFEPFFDFAGTEAAPYLYFPSRKGELLELADAGPRHHPGAFLDPSKLIDPMYSAFPTFESTGRHRRTSCSVRLETLAEPFEIAQCIVDYWSGTETHHLLSEESEKVYAKAIGGEFVVFQDNKKSDWPTMYLSYDGDHEAEVDAFFEVFCAELGIANLQR